MRINHFISTIVLFALMGCESKPQQSPLASLKLHTVDNPAAEMCRDDTLTPTERFNVPVVIITAASIQLNGQVASEQQLKTWANDYYKNRTERALWVEIAPDGAANAQYALRPIAEIYPELQLRQVRFGFVCPKLAGNK